MKSDIFYGMSLKSKLELHVFILLLFHILLHETKEFGINKTNILYQYSLLCGPDLFDESENVWLLPKVSQQHKICPECSKDVRCYHHGNCCPDLYLSFPPRECSDVIIFEQHTDDYVKPRKYELVSSCPEKTYSELNENCVKTHAVRQQIKMPPVYSASTGLSFKNQFCAFCHNISDTIQWSIRVSELCINNRNVTEPEDILDMFIDEKCGTIEFYPGFKVTDKRCSDFIKNKVIDMCNVTGTWKTYDKDIEFACMNFENSFKFYKNIFCFICNPPDVDINSEVISGCNMTGKWDTYNKTMADSCFHGDATLAAYPFKNIYCYLCNAEIPRKNTFFINMDSNSRYEYLVFNISDGLNLYRIDNETDNCQNFSTILTEYHTWDVKYTCYSILPLSLLDNDIYNLQRLAIKQKCVSNTGYSSVPIKPISDRFYKGYSSLPIKPISDILDINWAFETDKNQVYIIGNDGLARCYPKGYAYTVCNLLQGRFSVNCEDVGYRLPIYNLICILCEFPAGVVETENRPMWNIFHVNSYDNLPQKCNEGEIYDETKQKCRKTGCFMGKSNINGQCWQYETPFVIFENISRPRIGYTLPFRFDVSNNSLDHFIMEVTENFTHTYNMSTSFCPTLLENGTSFHLQLDISEISSTTKNEHKLLKFLESFIEMKMGYPDTVISFDPKTKNIVNQKSEFNDCKAGWRPLLSNILICRHVIFEQDEYTEDNDKVTFNDFRNVFDFNQYHIGADRKLWLCLDDFNTLQENNSLYQQSNQYYVPITVCNMISTIFLLITVITYCLFPKLRTVPGKNIMSLSVSLIFHYITLIFVMTIQLNGTGCKILGILAHYFLLTSFGCLFVCAFHMFKIFGTGSIASSMTASRHRYVIQRYVFFSYGYAFVLITGNIIYNIAATSGNLIGYGHKICFINFKGSVIATLLVPLTVLSVVDIVLYVITVFRLKQRPQVNHGETMDRSDLGIFIKLFTVTGCSWILLLINAFVDVPELAAFISGLNGLQGLYIFTAYICNKRIYNLYVTKCRMRNVNRRKNRSPSTSMTSLSRLKTNLVERDSPLLQKRNNTECHA